MKEKFTAWKEVTKNKQPLLDLKKNLASLNALCEKVLRVEEEQRTQSYIEICIASIKKSSSINVKKYNQYNQ